MGNSQFSSGGNVAVALQRTQFHAGDAVAGYVEVQSNGDMQCTELIAHFHGEIRTCVHYTRTHEEYYEENGERKSRTVTTRHQAYQRMYIVEESRHVARFATGVAPPGLYQFPFQFNLHPSLPSSVFVSGHDHASIMYGVEVRLMRPGMFKPDLVHRAMFDLIAHVPHPVTPSYTIDRKEVSCCCCFGQGSITLAAALDRNAFRANDPIGVRVELQNESKAEVQRVDVEVHEEIYFHAQGHGERKVVTIARASIMGPFAPGEGFGEALGSQHKVVEMRLPQFNHCSLTSRLLTIGHSVRVIAQTGFGITNPSIDLPVTLHRSDLVQAPFAPPLHEGEELGFGVAVAYAPNPAALHSPVPLDMSPSAPVAPWHDTDAPQQQDMGQQPQMAQQAMGQQPQMAQQAQQAMPGPGYAMPAMQELSSGQYPSQGPGQHPGQHPGGGAPAMAQPQVAQMAQPAMGAQAAQAMGQYPQAGGPVFTGAAPVAAMSAPADLKQPLIVAQAMPMGTGARDQ